MKIFLLNGSKVWLDPETAPAEAIPYGKPKAEPKKAEPEKKTEPEQKAKPEPANKAKKAPANKSRKAGSNK